MEDSNFNSQRMFPLIHSSFLLASVLYGLGDVIAQKLTRFDDTIDKKVSDDSILDFVF